MVNGASDGCPVLFKSPQTRGQSLRQALCFAMYFQCVTTPFCMTSPLRS